MVHEVVLPDGHVISDDRTRIDIEMIQRSLAGTYWARHKSPALIARSWAHCLCFGVHAPGGGQVGFGRLLTDYAFRAHLGDVFIEPPARGRGLGRALLEAILAHPALATVDRWTLATADAHPLYERYGFRTGEADPKWMTLDRSRRDPTTG